jgi:hypothetical protein
MRKRQSIRMKRLTRKSNLALGVLPFSDERVTTQRRLDANLIALASLEPHLNK